MSLVKKEFNFTDQHFNHIREIVTEHSGIVLTDAKRDMVYSRLVRRLRKTGITNFDDYCLLLEDQNHEEFTHFSNAITTNLTSFFRENHHFEILAEVVLPEIMARNKATKTIRVWSAGCSTGMETYSIAMVLKEVIPENQGWDVKILATDLDTNVLKTGATGIYKEDSVTGVSDERMARWFMKGRGENSDKLKISKELRNIITFNQLNLLNPFPFKGPIDIIFCRNVVIYFDKPTQRILFEKFANIHANDSYLFIGHSETLYNVTDRYKLLRNTVYKKTN
ncbi:MAG: protein-glutamate O-methyltransferase [Gammaproteobacteria bacterium]|nr:protein-glutamate O-methyltransferase [Gammaproteobacteria bacterium]